MQSKAVTLVAQATAWEILDYHWSPDSQWIAYTRPEERQMPRIYLYSLAAGKSWPATDGWYAAEYPTFSADGKYLFFVSDRSFQPSYGRVEENYNYFDMGRIYFVTLAKDTKSPWLPAATKCRSAGAPRAPRCRPRRGAIRLADEPVIARRSWRPAGRRRPPQSRGIRGQPRSKGCEISSVAPR